MTKAHHSIRVASSRSGVSQHVIRIWEKRYAVVEPQRTPTNRRLYSDAEIERLILLRLATAAGHGIGNVARLPTGRLKELVGEASSKQNGASAKRPAQAFHDSCLQSVKSLNAHRLQENLQRALIALGHQGLLRQVVAPLTQTVGALWRAGVITAAHEHFLTASLKVFLGNAAGQFPVSSVAPVMVVATPAGQLHELGAVIINAAAAQLGWRTIYLGASLPAAEIAGAALQANALVVALSIVYPEDDPNLPNELISLRRFLPPEVEIVTGGRGAAAYKGAISTIGARQAGDLDTFSRELDALRASRPDRAAT